MDIRDEIIIRTTQHLNIIFLVYCAVFCDTAIAARGCGSPQFVPDGNVVALVTAINCANSDGSNSIIELAANGSYTLTATNNTSGANGLPAIANNGSFTLNGNGATISRDEASLDNFRIMLVNTGANATINDVTLSGGDGSVGGGLRVLGTVTVNNSTISDNAASRRIGSMKHIFRQTGRYAVPNFTVLKPATRPIWVNPATLVEQISLLFRF